MCETCGCNVTPGNEHLVRPEGKLGQTADGRAAITVLQGLLTENDRQAAHNRAHFDQHGVLAINLMSSPGAGKTALLEATIEALGSRLRIAVVEGDLETENDAERIRAKGVPAIQIATGSACHLDAHMVHDALHQLDLTGVDILFIENVGNLVCPASFDLGQHRNITLLSVPEGDDKPAKYPVMFRAADLVLLTKTDLLAVLDDFDPARAEGFLRNLATTAPLHQISTRRGAHGIGPWLGWLLAELAAQRERLAAGQSARPNIQPDGIARHATGGEAGHRHADGHDHRHAHPHDHAHRHDYAHAHGHLHQYAHDHGHDHGHSHQHGHDHGHDHGRDHGHDHDHAHPHAHHHVDFQAHDRHPPASATASTTISAADSSTGRVVTTTV